MSATPEDVLVEDAADAQHHIFVVALRGGYFQLMARWQMGEVPVLTQARQEPSLARALVERLAKHLSDHLACRVAVPTSAPPCADASNACLSASAHGETTEVAA